MTIFNLTLKTQIWRFDEVSWRFGESHEQKSKIFAREVLRTDAVISQISRFEDLRTNTAKWLNMNNTDKIRR